VTQAAFRVGHGYDLHRLQSGGKLILAGVAVPSDVSPAAHSDGDVALHAVVDALLGAMGWGDIGQWFADSDPKWKGADSRVFVRTVYDKILAEGFVVANLDVTILAERPRLGPQRQAMVQSLTDLLGGLVNVKACTNEGCDAIGRGQAIAAHAVVLLMQKPASDSSPPPR
jgi:2-C-methyl-D-erythritol 2,4-cyclodiphosphate synthase